MTPLLKFKHDTAERIREHRMGSKFGLDKKVSYLSSSKF